MRSKPFSGERTLRNVYHCMHSTILILHSLGNVVNSTKIKDDTRVALFSALYICLYIFQVLSLFWWRLLTVGNFDFFIACTTMNLRYFCYFEGSFKRENEWIQGDWQFDIYLRMCNQLSERYMSITIIAIFKWKWWKMDWKRWNKCMASTYSRFDSTGLLWHMKSFVYRTPINCE